MKGDEELLTYTSTFLAWSATCNDSGALGGVARTDTETGRRGESWGCRYRAGWFGQISIEHLGKINVCESGGGVGLRHGKAGRRRAIFGQQYNISGEIVVWG
jgi:hypothetical protein